MSFHLSDRVTTSDIRSNSTQSSVLHFAPTRRTSAVRTGRTNQTRAAASSTPPSVRRSGNASKVPVLVACPLATMAVPEADDGGVASAVGLAEMVGTAAVSTAGAAATADGGASAGAASAGISAAVCGAAGASAAWYPLLLHRNRIRGSGDPAVVVAIPDAVRHPADKLGVRRSWRQQHRGPRKQGNGGSAGHWLDFHSSFPQNYGRPAAISPDPTG
jgi:hypothetical protein